MTTLIESLLARETLTVRDVARVFQISRRTVWRWVELGRLPQPVRYSRKSVRWNSEGIRACLHTVQRSTRGRRKAR